MKRTGFWALLATPLVLLGCATQGTCGDSAATNCEPIRNVVDAPIVAELSMTRISEAIRLAGVAAGWQMHPQAPGSIQGRLELRSHVAVVDVEHDTKSYSITYRESSNLSEGGGMIHRNYNGWIRSLDKSIRLQLAQR